MNTDQLPEAVRAKLDALALIASDCEALAHVATGKLRELMRVIADPLTDDEARELLSAEAETTKVLQAQRQAKSRNVNQTVLQVRRWLDSLSAATILVPAESVEVETNNSQEVLDLLSETRERIKTLKAEHRQIGLAPPTIAELNAQVADYVADLALGVTLDGVRPIFPAIEPRHDTHVAMAMAMQFAAWHDAKALIARICKDVEAAHSNDAMAIDSATRTTRLVVLEADLLAAERQEETIVCRAEAVGLRVERRKDADARAILGVEIAKKQKTARAA